MDKQRIWDLAIGPVVTAAVLGAVALVWNLVAGGAGAELDAKTVRTINSQLTVDVDGETKTYGQVMSLLISEVRENRNEIRANRDEIEDNADHIEDLEDVMRTLVRPRPSEDTPG